ncbi:hypothetical protein PT974_00267 [Cladobotryum mycophilum]|uniref:Uncharacterized protein n=1 Tax=Cladobotryum mycophilum TaxID=491253 RepID=A0ABR0T0B6_9HYPO
MVSPRLPTISTVQFWSPSIFNITMSIKLTTTERGSNTTKFPAIVRNRASPPRQHLNGT